MIQKFVDRFTAAETSLLAKFKESHVANYKTLVEIVVRCISDDTDDKTPDYDRIHEINDGHYQGTLLYLIADKGYQPSDYWYVRVSYGSCSGCDTLQAINGYSDEPPTDEQAREYWTLALHIVQGLKELP